jgi:hypothetical protein
MNAIKRPAAVLIVSCLYIAVGAIGFAYHFHQLKVFEHDSVWIEVTELLAILCGVFMHSATICIALEISTSNGATDCGPIIDAYAAFLWRNPVPVVLVLSHSAVNTGSNRIIPSILIAGIRSDLAIL